VDDAPQLATLGVQFRRAELERDVRHGAYFGPVKSNILKLGNPDERVQKQDVDALVQMGQTAVPALAEALKDKEPGVRQIAAKALGRIGPKPEAAVPALTEALKDKEGFVRWVAAQALAQIGETAVPALIKSLGADHGPDVHRYAAEALVKIGEPAVPALTKALRDKDNEWTVRQSAALALGAMGLEARDAVPALAEARRKDDVDAVRKAADEALQKIQAAK
jgi:HEAT repeat protein